MRVCLLHYLCRNLISSLGHRMAAAVLVAKSAQALRAARRGPARCGEAAASAGMRARETDEPLHSGAHSPTDTIP